MEGTGKTRDGQDEPGEHHINRPSADVARSGAPGILAPAVEFVGAVLSASYSVEDESERMMPRDSRPSLKPAFPVSIQNLRLDN